jgi:hypothetical protein
MKTTVPKSVLESGGKSIKGHAAWSSRIGGRRGGAPEAQVARGCRNPGISESRTKKPWARCRRKGLPVEPRSAFFRARAVVTPHAQPKNPRTSGLSSEGFRSRESQADCEGFRSPWEGRLGSECRPKGLVCGGLRSALFVDAGGTSSLLSQKTAGLLDSGLVIPEPRTQGRIGVGSEFRPTGSWAEDCGRWLGARGEYRSRRVVQRLEKTFLAPTAGGRSTLAICGSGGDTLSIERSVSHAQGQQPRVILPGKSPRESQRMATQVNPPISGGCFLQFGRSLDGNTIV